ncbi:replication protein A 70 kDa DNA-binding subunit, partial [Striga asiatica]
VMMSRTYLPISQITDETRNWTALIQVVKRAPIQASKRYQSSCCRQPWRSSMGCYFRTRDTTLLEQKCGQKARCTKLYQVGPYEFNWLLHKKTLVEELQEEVPPPLSKSKFIRLWTCTNTQIQKTPEKMMLVNNLANTVAAGNIILAMRTRVTTYAEKKADVAKLVEEGVYKDIDKLFPYPSASDLTTTKTCWVAGKLKFGDNRSLWTTICNNCRKIYTVPPNTPVKCRSCKEDTLVEARCRLPIAIEDETGNIHAMLYDSNAERVIPFNGTDLYQAEEQGVDLTAQITAEMNEHHVVCFIKHYELTHHTVLKLYTIDDMQADKKLLKPKELAKEGSASASTKVTDKELFSPTLKNVLTSLTPAREMPTTIASSESAVKKCISFYNQQSSTPRSSIPFTQIPESSTQQTHQTSTISNASPTRKVVQK